MVNIWVDGEILDTPEGVKLSLTRKNNAWSFGSLELGRSLQFQVPATPKNNKIFSIANDVHRDGELARVQLDAQIQYSGGAFNGLLYLSDATSAQYTCVFVFGELLPLKALSDAEVGGLSATAQITPRLDANGSHRMDLFAPISYRNGNQYVMPSVRLAGLFRTPERGVVVHWADGMELVRVIPSELNPPSYTTTLAKYSEYFAIKDLADNGILVRHQLYGNERKSAIIQGQIVYQGEGVRDEYIAEDFALGDGVDSITIKFGADFPSDVFCMQYRSHTDCKFFGGYEFNTNFPHDGVRNTIVGLPLANREITIERTYTDSQGVEHLNTFSFYDIERWYNDGGGLTPLTAGFIGWDDCRQEDGEVDVYNFAVGIESKTAGDVSDNISYSISDNIPDVGYTDIINILATIYGKRVVCDGNDVRFADYDISDWRVVELADIVGYGNIERTFSDFAQHNSVVFDSSEWVLSRLRADYVVRNANIESNKEIATIPFSEGNADGACVSVVDLTTYREAPDEFTTENRADKPTIAVCGEYADMERISLHRIGALDELCDESTNVEISCKMPLAKYMSIADDCILQADGARYVWLSSTWDADTAKFVCQKLS